MCEKTLQKETEVGQVRRELDVRKDTTEGDRGRTGAQRTGCVKRHYRRRQR